MPSTPLPVAVTFAGTPPEGADIAVYALAPGRALAPAADALDAAAGGVLARALATNPAFKGTAGQALFETLPQDAPGPARVVLLGMDAEPGAAEAAPESLRWEQAGGKIFASLEAYGARSVTLYANSAAQAAHIATGFALRAWRFTTYKKPKADAPQRPEALTLITDDPKAAKALWDNGLEAVVAGTCTARDLISEPPNALYPESYADRISKLLKPLGVEVEILDEKKLAKLGMGAILAVGQGSARPPRLVIMRWHGAGAGTAAPIALVGKGITFDTGGISIKPSAKMDEMKADMAGSAAVVGAVEALARARAPVPVVAAVALAENMPSDRACRPADIITTYAGKTVEVLNTDAEGRLVLADALAYVQEAYRPRAVVDVATLTGAIVVALGEEYAGAFVNDDALWGALAEASRATGEKIWRMPLAPAFREQVESAVADLQNIGKIDRAAGACTAAAFLEHFVQDGVPWAHLDIAGVGLFGKARPAGPKGATGFGVRLLTDWVKRQA